MSYRELYNHCQTLDLYVGRNAVRDKALEFTGVEKVRTFRTTLDTTVTRGAYLSAQNTEHQFVRQAGTHVIILAREGLNDCWERFVYVKELMHLFDNPMEATDSGDAFDRLLSDITSAPLERSAQMTSELKAFWMALGVLCPEHIRTQLQADRDADLLDNYAIALQLMIPQQYVNSLFYDGFKRIIDGLCDGTI